LKRYRLSPAARLDVLQIWHYICDNTSVQKADSVVAELKEAFAMLAQHPGVGHVRLDLADESVRFWTVKPYHVIYRPDKKSLQIARVLHAARDVKSILSPDE
jgi:toxin ParE1/3/4